MTTRPNPDPTDLETFKAPIPPPVVKIDVPEFTCLCPKTGQPDFAYLTLWYEPESTCVELKALKLYLWSFRDRGAFHEAVTEEIAQAIAARIAPRWLLLEADWFVRGGLHTTAWAARGEVPEGLVVARVSRSTYRGDGQGG